MAFLYGDSTPSPLESNFLEFLRDALDFSVLLLHADANIEGIRERKRGSARSAEEELERLQVFGRAVIAAIQDASMGDADSETARCAAQLCIASTDAVSSSTDAVHRALAQEIARADADEAAQREASFRALESLLLPHAPPDSSASTNVLRQADGTHTVEVLGDATGMGLRWRIELAIPEGHLLAGPSPLDRLAPQMEFLAPEQTGWLKKELRPRPQRMDRFVLSEAKDDGKELVLKLRSPAGEQGFDFFVNLAASAVSASKTSKEGDSEFELAEEDAPKIISLAENLRTALTALRSGKLVQATFDGEDFRLHPLFRDVVERLVIRIAPIVQEVAKHSLTPTELVIRRLLSNERREEIFVTKRTLREKYADLPRDQRSLFDPFGFDTLPPPPPLPTPEVPAPSSPPAADEEGAVLPPLRSEVAPSQPPPAPPWLSPPSWPPGSTPRWRRRPNPRSSSED